MSVDQVSTSAVAQYLGATAIGTTQFIVGIRPLSSPEPAHLSFSTTVGSDQGERRAALEVGAIVLAAPGSESESSGAGTLIIVERPRAAYAAVVTRFFASEPEPGVASSAVVHPTASVSPSASVGEFTVIGPGAVIGDGCEVRHHCVIGPGVRLGSNCLIKSHAVIGEDGFGLETDEDGNNVRLPHLGSVHIGDWVEVGSFTSINAGTIDPTVIGDYVKISDNVHISHNNRVGRNTIITGSVMLSGSVTIGDGVWLAPNVSVREKLTIGDGATVGIGSVVVRAVGPGEVHYGNPARRQRGVAQ